MAYRFIRLVYLTLLIASGCSVLAPPPTPTSTATPLPTFTPTPASTPTPTLPPTFTPEPPDTGWQPLRPGVELRQVRVEVGQTAERLAIVRLDPAAVRFRLHYDPDTPHLVSDWADGLDQPLLVINAGYFTPEHQTIGLLVSDGQIWGASYGDYAGMFAVTPDERVSVRWLRDWPYDPSEQLSEAVQSFPVLVKPGGVMGFPADADDGRPSRRTVVAQDNQGRILLMVAPRGYLSLHETARFLAKSDLDLDVALNLDGGYSTGLWLQADERLVDIKSLVPVPSVISVVYR
ncbi:MAG: phosphodiester glycosidase family protein [Chloroflexi bacterium]|nr:phosphodiester glycosidase family protein [Chloroflexota bacterium]